MLSEFKNCKTMGVINVTPNSFSDPNKFFNTTELTKALLTLKDRPDLILDFGFESTAPMNASIAAEEERGRFLHFFDLVKSIDLNDRWISFDTYRPSSFRFFETRFKERYKGQGFLFNDVSGVLDDELEDLLKEKTDDPFFKYIFSFTHIPSRSETGKHMTFLREGDVVKQALEHFQKAQDKFKSWGVDHKIIFDPCFGFSKSYEQNWDLIRHFPKLSQSFSSDRSWLIGLSKKSFLRKSLPPETSDLFAEAEKLHEDLIVQFLKNKYGHLLFRVHDFEIVDRAEKKLRDEYA